MVKLQIEDLKHELNRRISQGSGLNDVYDLSVQLDKLILQYYREHSDDKQLI